MTTQKESNAACIYEDRIGALTDKDNGIYACPEYDGMEFEVFDFRITDVWLNDPVVALRGLARQTSRHEDYPYKAAS